MTAAAPVQLVVVSLEDAAAAERVLHELAQLQAHDAVRLRDLVAVRMRGGRVERIAHERLDREAIDGAMLGALFAIDAPGGAGDAELTDDEVWYLEDAIPEGAVAAIALIEHRWAVPLPNAIEAAGSAHLADAWVHPVDLAASGLASPSDAAS